MQGTGNKPGNRDGRYRGHITSGILVDIIQKQDQRSGKKTRGIVNVILTSSSFHPHGIKVRLQDGTVGRVQVIPVPGTE